MRLRYLGYVDVWTTFGTMAYKKYEPVRILTTN
jgi:hypothetical protein